MNEEILGLLGLPAEEIARYRQQATMSGLGALGQALIQAGAPRQGTRQGTLAGIAQALPAYGAGRQASMDQVLQDLLRRQQVQQMVAQQQAKQRQQTALENLMRGQSPDVQARLQAFPGSAESVLFPKADRRVISPGDVLLEGNVPVYEAPKPVEETTEIRTLRVLLENPDLLNAAIRIQSAKTPKTTNIFDMGKGQQELFKEVDVPIVQGFATAANSSREFARTSETINRLLKGKGGGEIVKIGTDLAKTLGLQNDQIAAQDLANSLVVQLAPRMRAPGSGSTSDIEFKSYISAVPSLSNSERGREIMAKYATAFADRNAKLADYAKKLASQNKLTFEAIATYDESLGPVLKEDFYGLVETSPAPSRSGGVIDFRSQTRGGR